MRLGSLFSGYGGLELAVKSLFPEVSTAWVSDIDKGANKILAHNFPSVPNLGDITKVDWNDVEPVDILTGGFPCQDLSNAGKQAGLVEGTRSGLWFQMTEAINHLEPQLVVIENVRGLLSAKTAASQPVITYGPKGGKRVGHTNLALGRVLADLADLGYDARWFGLRAADVGAPHGRFRVFITASPRGEFPTPPDASSNGRHQGWPQPAGQQGGPDASLSGPLLPTPVVNDMGAGKTVEEWDDWTARMKAKHGNSNGHGPSLSIEAQRLLPTPTTRDHKDHAIRREPHRPNDTDTLSRALTEFGPYTDAVARWSGILRPAPAPTAPTGRAGQQQLAPAFVEWMMGLPAGHVTDVPDLIRTAQLKALGNGVVPQQAAAALRTMLTATT